jgi:DNA-binding MarR family transcriptional regulator
MLVFEKLRARTAFEKQHLPQLKTLEDHRLVHEVGYHQSQGRPLTLKQLFLLDTGSIATVQRRLRRLKQLGVIQQRRSATDRRAVELTLSPKYQRLFARYGQLLAGQHENGSCHLCSPYDSDAAREHLVGAFLGEGLRRGEHCILVAPAAMQGPLLAALGERRRQVVVSRGERSAEAQLAFFREQFTQGRLAGKAVRAAGDVGWTADCGLPFDEVMDLEARLDPLARQFRARVLCLYDARRFPGPALVRALKQHRDSTRLPLLLA